ncbi:MAG: hypothetical protein JOY54_18660 [Acidobacteriaceae bacterium]|nr:hypothetical protein [Acidobacteriaceae bacterium]
MRYFERKPYEELLRTADAVPGLPAEPAASPVSTSRSLVDRALMILREESGSLPNDAPALSPPLVAYPAVAAPVLLQASPVRAGQKALLVISLINESEDTVSSPVAFTDLVSAAGERIAAANLTPVPGSPVVPPRGTSDVRIEIDIPLVSAGRYFGTLVSPDAAPAVLAVIVDA